MATPQTLDTPRLLDFTTTVERQPVRIDGITYQMRLGRDMSYSERQRIAQLAFQLSEPLIAMGAGSTLPKAQQKAVDRLLLEACQMAVNAPLKVIKRIDQVDQIVLAMTFFERSVKGLRALSELMTPGSRSNGTKPSPSSPGSTGAARSNGKPASRSAKSTRT